MSVILSVFNGADVVSDAVESILSQTFNDFEFIIINDGSKDNTANILDRYNDARLKVLHQDNMGLTRSLNKGIKLSKGRYIARLDADEESLPGRLSRQVGFLDSNPEVGIVGSFCTNYDQVNGTKEDVHVPVTNLEIRKWLLKNNAFVHGSVMIRREVFENIGYYNEDFKYIQDYELWPRIANKYKTYNLPEVLLKRKITTQCISSNTLILSQRTLLEIQAQKAALKTLEAPFWCYLFLWRRLFFYLLYKFKIAKFPLKKKKDFLRLITRG